MSSARALAAAVVALCAAGDARAQDVAVRMRGGGEVVGRLEAIDETRLRIRTADGAREVPVGGVASIALSSPALAATDEARRLSAELEALLEEGAAGELSRIAELDAWLTARVEDLVEPARLRAWDGWPRWPLAGARGVVAGAPHLDALAPTVAQAARELAARGEDPAGALRLLRAIDTPAARGLLLGLYLDPRLWEPRQAVRLVPLLVDLDDPRLERVVRARIKRNWEGEVPDLPWEQLPLLLRHGDPAVLDATIRVISRAASGEQVPLPWLWLRFSCDRRALDVATTFLRWPGFALAADDERAVEALAGLVETWGAQGAARLLEAARDPRLPSTRRDLVVTALAGACPAEHVPASALLAFPAEGDAAETFARAARALAARDDVPLSPDDLDRMRRGVLALLQRPLAPLQEAAAEAIVARAALHTDDVRRALERALREPTTAEAALAAALEAVERTLGAGAR